MALSGRWRNAMIGGIVGFTVAVVLAGRGLWGEPSVADILADGVAELRPQLPIQVDEVTTWTDVTAEGETLTVHYTLLGPGADYDPAGLEDAIRPGVVAQVCAGADPTMAEGLRRGATYRYEYRGEDGVEVGAFEVRQADCG